MKNSALISQVYTDILPKLVRHIACRVNDREVARDLAQDVFLKLLESSSILICRKVIEGLVFRIARSVVYDYLRHYYVAREADAYIGESFTGITDETRQRIIADDLARIEEENIKLLSPQRRTIYLLRRFEGLSAKEIAARLGLSHRTVENHIFAGYGIMREAMRNAI